MSAADHLEVPRQHGLFNHHGIDLGDGTIAHYLEGREILRSSIEEFSKGSQIKIIPHDYCSPRGITLRRAMSRIGETDYNLLFNNCEHFAIWCKTGFHRSPQIEMLIEKGQQGLQKILPNNLMSKIDFALPKGILNQSNFDEEIMQLENLRIKLENQLSKIIEKIKNKEKSKDYQYKNKFFKYLLFNGQLIEDELNALKIIQLKRKKLSHDNHIKALKHSNSSE